MSDGIYLVSGAKSARNYPERSEGSRRLHLSPYAGQLFEKVATVRIRRCDKRVLLRPAQAFELMLSLTCKSDVGLLFEVDQPMGVVPLIGHAKHGGQLGRSRMKSDAATLAAGYASVLGFNLRQISRAQRRAEAKAA